ncbi:MAG: NADH-quinone oxidoreductase subunit NuoE [Planctomycetes bacterium]|nr:NADH-quinone oxidoreductase subunit NuoE [Planctomycetota bacterium]
MNEVLKEFVGAGRDALIPILQRVQQVEGYLSRESVAQVGQHLGLPASKVYGVATFYNQFRFQPKGRFHIQICRGTACHVKGSAGILGALQRELKVKAGETTRDGLFSLEVVACIGACGLAPVMCVNGEFHAKLTPDSVKKILDSYRGKAAGDVERK